MLIFILIPTDANVKQLNRALLCYYGYLLYYIIFIFYVIWQNTVYYTVFYARRLKK